MALGLSYEGVTEPNIIRSILDVDTIFVFSVCIGVMSVLLPILIFPYANWIRTPQYFCSFVGFSLGQGRLYQSGLIVIYKLNLWVFKYLGNSHMTVLNESKWIIFEDSWYFWLVSWVCISLWNENQFINHVNLFSSGSLHGVNKVSSN